MPCDQSSGTSKLALDLKVHGTTKTTFSKIYLSYFFKSTRKATRDTRIKARQSWHITAKPKKQEAKNTTSRKKINPARKVAGCECGRKLPMKMEIAERTGRTLRWAHQLLEDAPKKKEYNRNVTWDDLSSKKYPDSQETCLLILFY